ncbi:MAG: MFS transporter [Dehalococcoidia bacterium]|nr:MFS transporter [Dehalococcoidia bacterium]
MQPSNNPTKGRKLTFELLAIASSVVVMSQAANNLIVPAMPKFITGLGSTGIDLGIAIAMFSVARLITNIPAGLLTERLGRKPVLVGGAS